MNKLSLPMIVTPEVLRELFLPLAWKKILQGLKEKKLTPLSVRCAETTLEHLDPAPKWISQSPDRPVNVTIVLAAGPHPGTLSDSDGLQIHLRGDEGTGQ